MSSQVTLDRPTRRIDSEGRLILHVALPRLADQMDRVRNWLAEYRPEHFVEAAHDLRSIRGAEGLALLAALPSDARWSVLQGVDLEEPQRQGLIELCELLGSSEESGTPAAELVEMFPTAASSAPDVLEGNFDDAKQFVAKGDSAIEQSDLISAERWYRRALSIFERLGDDLLIAVTLTQIGQMRFNLADYSIALDCFRKALMAAPKASTKPLSEQWLPVLEARVLMRMGAALFQLRELNDAAHAFEQALEKARKLGDLSLGKTILANLGRVYLAQSEHQKAIGLFEESLTIAPPSTDRSDEWLAYLGLGGAYFAVGQFTKAAHFLKQGMTIAQEIGDEEWRTVILPMWEAARSRSGSTEGPKPPNETTVAEVV